MFRLIKPLSAISVAGALGACATSAPADDGNLDRSLLAMLAGKSAVSGQALDKKVAEAAAYDLGTKENPVRASGPNGQRAYLARLRCADLSAPQFSRIGSYGDSPYGNIMDGYDVRCADSEPAESVVFMDMYHAGHVEDEAVPGFGIVGGSAN